MIKINKKSIIKAFYYLMAADGEICKEEREKFELLGAAIDDQFAAYKEEVIHECDDHVLQAIGHQEYYEMIVEAFDVAVLQPNNEELEPVPSRLILWDMYSLAYINGQMTENERKLINHAIRVLKIDKSISLEMEHMCSSFADIQKEIEWAQSTNLAYGTVLPIVKELEERQNTIVKAAQALIEDELVKTIFPEDEIAEEKGFWTSLGESVAEIGTTAGKAISDFGVEAGQFYDDIANKVSSSGTEVMDNVSKFFGGLFNKKKNGEDK